MDGRQDILVVIDPTAAEQPALQRSLQLSRALDTGLELFICQHDARLAGRRLFAAAEREAMRRAQMEHQLGYLRSLARELGDAAPPVALKVVWDAPLSEGIVRETLRSEPRLVLKDTHQHTSLARALFSHTDWQLIRDCPAPLWLVKSGALQRPVILAAVDPMHEYAKPAALDELILDEAERLAGLLDGELHVYHGYDPTPEIARAGAFAMAPAPLPLDEIAQRVATAHREAFEQLLEGRALPDARRHLLPGNPVERLPALARQLGAGLVVMGAVARGRLKHATVGSTAERVLDHLPCDVLVLKPPGFESPVFYHPQARDFMQISG